MTSIVFVTTPKSAPQTGARVQMRIGVSGRDQGFPKMETAGWWLAFKACSSAADEGDDFDLVGFVKRRVVLPAADEAAVELDGYFFGGEFELRDELADGGAVGEV